MSAPSAGSLTAGSASYSSGTTRAIRPPTPARAMPPSHSRSRFSTVLTPRLSGARSVAMPMAQASGPLGVALDLIFGQER